MESKYAGLSPYNYGFNNPVKWTDSTGMEPDEGSKTDQTPKTGLTRVIKVEDANGKPINYPEGTHLPYNRWGMQADWDPFRGKDEIITGTTVLSEPTGGAEMVTQTIT